MYNSNLDGPPAKGGPPSPVGRHRSALAHFAAGRGGEPQSDAGGETLGAVLNAARWIRSTPHKLRGQAFAQIAPMLSFLPPALLEQLHRAPKDDGSLDGFIEQLERAIRPRGAVQTAANARSAGHGAIDRRSFR